MRTADAHAYREQLRQLASTHVDMPSEVRLEIAREAVREDFARAWKATDAKELVTTSSEFTQKVVDVCAGASDIAPVLASLAMHDGDTFAHICNVCAYTVMLARKVGISNEQELMVLGQAALLHDLGKRRICLDILTKPGKLTPAEREAMSDHPRLGFKELSASADLAQEQLLMVYQHHEKLNGTGYPVQLVGDEICWTARLCAVVDVFDALTARRSYRSPAAPQQAVEIIEQDVGKHFFEEYARCWSELVGHAQLSKS